MKYHLIIILSILLFSSCKEQEENQIPSRETITIRDQLLTNYTPLPEAQISQSSDQRIYATYTTPTKRYPHGILGDQIEASQLVVVVDSIFYELQLSDEYVFEDIRPRLYDVDGDGELEFITIRSNVSKGAGIVIYKIIAEELVEYAFVPEIGIANRWLNVVAIHDLDEDGIVELVWIQTPHIGGILKVAKIESGAMEVLAETSLYSNHAIGERNLCLSVLTEQSNQKVFYVPGQDRDRIVGFTFANAALMEFEVISQAVDFSKKLSTQFDFNGILGGEDNCIVE